MCSKVKGEAARLEVSGHFQKVSAKVENDIIDFLKSFSFVAMYNFFVGIACYNCRCFKNY